jgi:hypothetical protein
VKYLAQTEKGGVLLPDDIDDKYGLTIKAILKSKHPKTTTAHKSTIHQYESTPDFVNVDITQENVEQVAHNMSGSVDSQAVSHWLLAFGNTSKTLRHSLANFDNWLANKLPQWAIYRAMRSGRLLALDNIPGVRPIGIGETWRRAISKALLLILDSKVAMVCKTGNLCGGLQGGINGAIHAAQSMWDTHHMEDDWGFLLIDAKNAFNEQCRKIMPWNVRHEWPSWARFVFNSYKHWAILIIQNNDGT